MSSWIILCIPPANERRRYKVTSSVIGWVHSQNDLCVTVNVFLTEMLLSQDMMLLSDHIDAWWRIYRYMHKDNGQVLAWCWICTKPLPEQFLTLCQIFFQEKALLSSKYRRFCSTINVLTQVWFHSYRFHGSGEVCCHGHNLDNSQYSNKIKTVMSTLVPESGI